MAKQERREKVAQDLKERLGFDVAQMTPEEFASAVDAYIGQRLRAAEFLAALPEIFEQLQWSFVL